MRSIEFQAGAEQGALARTVLLARAQRGYAFLEQKFPGWRDDFDVKTLDIELIETCALAQAGGESDFYLTLDQLGLTEERAVWLGFFIDEDDDVRRTELYDILAMVWLELLSGMNVPEPLAYGDVERLLEPA